MTKLNMKWGSPDFLKHYWNVYANDIDIYRPFNTKEMSYQSTGKEELKNLIKELHKIQKNIEIDNKFVVIGNGATQILKGLFKIYGNIYAPAPYFSRFPVLSELVGSNFTSDSYDNEWKLHIHTIPNNPDVKTEFYRADHEIFDLSYNWPTYTNSIFNDSSIKTGVFSLSKATGHASTRIGWAIIEDESLKNELEQFIEYDTSGVSIEAQDKAINIISHINNYKLNSIFTYGKQALDLRWELIKKLSFSFEIVNNSGMFLLAKGEIPENIEVLPGKEMGLSDEFFRLNIGCSTQIFNEFIKR